MGEVILFTPNYAAPTPAPEEPMRPATKTALLIAAFLALPFVLLPVVMALVWLVAHDPS